MNKTNIEWTDYSWNPVTGCLHDCDYCYAKKVAERFQKLFPNEFNPTFYPERLTQPRKLKKPSKIFVGSMTDMFGGWVCPNWIIQTLDAMKTAPQHQYQMLTKNPVRIQNFLPKEVPLPDNLWIGTTIDWPMNSGNRAKYIRQFTGGIKYISFEPLLGKMWTQLEDINWIIIGAQTNPTIIPKQHWVEQLIKMADNENIPVFLKSNLGPLFEEFGARQEFPEYKEWKH